MGLQLTRGGVSGTNYRPRQSETAGMGLCGGHLPGISEGRDVALHDHGLLLPVGTCHEHGHAAAVVLPRDT